MLTHTHTFEFYLVHNVSTVIFYWTLSEVPAVTWKAKIMEKKHSPNMGGCFVFAVLRAYFRSLEALKERWLIDVKFQERLLRPVEDSLRNLATSNSFEAWQTMVDRWNIPYLGRARPAHATLERSCKTWVSSCQGQSDSKCDSGHMSKTEGMRGFVVVAPSSEARLSPDCPGSVGSDLNAAWPAWANAAQESAGAAFRKAADAARVHAGQVKAAVDSQVWPGLPPTGGEASPFESEVPFHGSLPPVRLRVCSWNLHGNMIEESDDVRKWLMPDDEPADLVLVAVQELVDLGPKTVVMNPNGDEQRQMLLERRVEQALSKGGRYVKVCGFGMVGLALLVYIQPWLACGLRQLRIDRVKTGLDGMGGNKGGVCARFLLGSLSVCLVNVHLASGQHATTERSQHLAQVLSDAFQGTSAKGALRPKKLGFERSSVYHVEAHELCIITGDFNSRLDLPKEAQWPSGPQEAWLARDQIMLGQVSSLRGYREGVITFAPTYKYKIGTDALNTKRAPAWCDRVVFKSEAPCQLQLLEYASLPDLRFTSDHHPVTALFEVE
ncbi:4 [Durusdinium trenchii]|uniref:4 n=1 Tax=Durusdinium trenchii TaxID=1381693 RepID=A0ABP0JV89_9DINO